LGGGSDDVSGAHFEAEVGQDDLVAELAGDVLKDDGSHVS
jgi:hypothetical protein